MSLDFIPAAKPIIGDEERAAVDAVLASGMLAQGKQVAEFETEFSSVLVDGRAAVAVNSGSTSVCWPPASARATKLSCRRLRLPPPATRWH
jgi:dTDP-4-amino-4,6-dideoxygalactose transaminase